MDIDCWAWDDTKNAENKRKHGLSFETAILVFADAHAQSYLDPYEGEERWQTYGFVQHFLIVVVHTEPVLDGKKVLIQGRIISARKATSHERRNYEDADHGW